MRNRTAPEGFSLVELMVVVSIIGILAAVAVPSYKSYVYRSRVTEGTTMLGNIKQAQEAYRNEFGRYCAVNGQNFAGMHPAAVPGGQPAAWNPGAAPIGWAQLGASPEGMTYFSYSVSAGPPGTTPPGVPGFNGNDFWFVGRAFADLDDDGRQLILENYSAADHVYMACPVIATPCESGYE